MPHRPTTPLQRPPEPLDGRILTPLEVATIVAAVDTTTLAGKRDRALLGLLVATGVRRDEARHLRVSDIQHTPKGDAVRVRARVGHPEHWLGLPPATARDVQAWITAARPERRGPGVKAAQDHLDPHDPPLFCRVRADSTLGGRCDLAYLSGTSIRQIVVAAAERAALTLGGSAVTPADLRRTFIRDSLAAGQPLESVQAAAGHRTPATTVRYAPPRRRR